MGFAMLTRTPIVIGFDALDEVKTFLRIDGDEDDASLIALIQSALGHGEDFTGQTFLQRSMTQRLGVSRDWQRLAVTPVRSILSVTGVPAEGSTFLLSAAAYGIDIDNNGDGWIRVIQPGSAGRIDVVFTTGLAESWAALPETLRQGAVRLAAHLFTSRDAADDAGPPTAVAALWRPWRRMRLTSGSHL